MNRAVMLLLVAWLAGCASSPVPLPERQIKLTAAPDRVLKAGLSVLVERGFVIQLADADLGRIDAVRASRPGYAVRLETQATTAGTQLTLSGRQGRQAIAPQRFDRLLEDITQRLEVGP